jgi:hypothetical protein
MVLTLTQDTSYLEEDYCYCHKVINFSLGCAPCSRKRTSWTTLTLESLCIGDSDTSLQTATVTARARKWVLLLKVHVDCRPRSLTVCTTGGIQRAIRVRPLPFGNGTGCHPGCLYANTDLQHGKEAWASLCTRLHRLPCIWRQKRVIRVVSLRNRLIVGLDNSSVLTMALFTILLASIHRTASIAVAVAGLTAVASTARYLTTLRPPLV